MLAKKNEQDLTEAIRGPIGIMGLALVIIAGTLAVADNFKPDVGDAPADGDRKLFGTYLTSIINEVMYYAKWGVYLAILFGGLMIGITLRTRVQQHDDSTGGR